MSNVQNNCDTSDEELFDDGLDEAYKMLYIKWNEDLKYSDKQRDNIQVLLLDKARLIATISDLKE